MTIHKSIIPGRWVVRGLDHAVVFRGSWDECHAYCEAR